MESTAISVIQHSTSINNAFISTVDHLPCDVIRSLWLIQSCNIESDSIKSQLNNLIKRIQSNPKGCKSNCDTLNRIVNYKLDIKRFDRESLQESRAIYNQLLIHKTTLMEELGQLEAISAAGVNKTSESIIDAGGDSATGGSGYIEIDAAQKLRSRLLEHYKENPLKSQLEAIKEQERMKILEQEEAEILKKKMQKIQKLGNISKLQKNKRPVVAGGKLKLVLKIPNKEKSETRGRPRKYPVEITGQMVGGVKVVPKLLKIDMQLAVKEFEATATVPTTATIVVPASVSNSTSSTNKKSSKKKAKVVVVDQPIEEDYMKEEPVPEEVIEEKYCFCKQGSFGNMIGCDNESACPNGDWFHYKCVGLLNKVEAMKYSTGKVKWYCSDSCKQIHEEKLKRKLKKKKRRW